MHPLINLLWREDLFFKIEQSLGPIHSYLLWGNFENFKIICLSQYWSHTHQLKIRLKIDSGIYSETKGMRPFTEYFNDYVLMATYLDPPYSPP